MEVLNLSRACERNNLQLQECIYKNPPRSVYTAFHLLTQQSVVLKTQRFGLLDSNEELMTEINSLTRLVHPGIVTYYGGFWFYSSKVTWDAVIVMEKAETDLMCVINRRKVRDEYWSDQEILSMAYNLADALDYCELHSICHRDIKPANILSTNAVIKLTDFGISKLTTSEPQVHTICGSVAYLSPILRANCGQTRHIRHNPYKSDVYSLGVTLFVMCNLGLPARLFTPDPDLARDIPNIRYSDTVKRLLTAMLETNEDLRPSSNQIMSAIGNVLGFYSSCPHITAGFSVKTTTPCHGNLCEFCYIEAEKGSGNYICRLCLRYETTKTGPNSPAMCTFCHNSAGKIPICESHFICSEDCFIEYFKRNPSSIPPKCPICSTVISTETLQTLLKNTEIPGFSVRCVSCNTVQLVELSVFLKCEIHAICQYCLNQADSTIPKYCVKCNKSETRGNTESCGKCGNLCRIERVFRFDCGHFICESCVSVSDLRRCPLCLTVCEGCKRQVSRQEGAQQACGHVLCTVCRQMPCRICYTYCAICRAFVLVRMSFPLECGRHSVCLSHGGLIRCQLCKQLARK